MRDPRESTTTTIRIYKDLHRRCRDGCVNLSHLVNNYLDAYFSANQNLAQMQQEMEMHAAKAKEIEATIEASKLNVPVIQKAEGILNLRQEITDKKIRELYKHAVIEHNPKYIPGWHRAVSDFTAKYNITREQFLREVER